MSASITEMFDLSQLESSNTRMVLVGKPDNPPYLAGRVLVDRGSSWFFPFSLFPPFFEHCILFCKNMWYFTPNWLFSRKLEKIPNFRCINDSNRQTHSLFYSSLYIWSSQVDIHSRIKYQTTIRCSITSSTWCLYGIIVWHIRCILL